MSATKSKEEIIIEDMEGVSDGWQTTYQWDSVKKGMDIYAKQEAILFCEDVLNNIEVNGVRIIGYKKINVKHLYNIYLKSKQ